MPPKNEELVVTPPFDYLAELEHQDFTDVPKVRGRKHRRGVGGFTSPPRAPRPPKILYPHPY